MITIGVMMRGHNNGDGYTQITRRVFSPSGAVAQVLGTLADIAGSPKLEAIAAAAYRITRKDQQL